jgi:hypothetical protein
VRTLSGVSAVYSILNLYIIKFLITNIDRVNTYWEYKGNMFNCLNSGWQKQTNSVALSPWPNYTDWATSTCGQNSVPTFVDRGVLRGQRGLSPTVVNFSFLDWSCYFSFKSLLIYPHKGRVDPVPDPLLLRKSCNTGNRTRDLWVSSQELWPQDHRGRNRGWQESIFLAFIIILSILFWILKIKLL